MIYKNGTFVLEKKLPKLKSTNKINTIVKKRYLQHSFYDIKIILPLY